MTSKQSKSDDHEFPTDIILGILSRLPVKSLARFRCVSKSWLKHINHPSLQTIHLQEDPTPIIFRKPHYVNHTKLCEISFLHVTQGTTTATKEPVLDFCFTGSTQMRTLVVLGSCNGLILVCYKKHTSYGIFLALLNPLRKECHNLPPIMPMHGFYMRMFNLHAAGIAFDESTNTLKTVSVFVKELDRKPQLCTMVHTLGTSSWREIAQIPACPINGEGIYAQGRLHWLARSKQIVWFDVKMEEFGLIDTPGAYRYNYDQDIKYDHLVYLNGEVGIAYRYNAVHVKLWVLKPGGWVLRCSFDVDVLPYHVVVSGCLNKDGDILLNSSGEDRLFVYTMKSRVLREVELEDRCVGDIRMYQSSFSSIHAGIK